jgi:hypothetical protein
MAGNSTLHDFRSIPHPVGAPASAQILRCGEPSIVAVLLHDAFA